MSNLQEQQPFSQQKQQLNLKIKNIKLKRINELNNKLRNELSRERITASNACLTIINYTNNTKDYTLPDIWGYPPPGSNHFRNNLKRSIQRPTTSSNSAGCCTIM
ncbi:Ste18p NDAI_0D00590 [Naumovozyma dairenensis CBS 421]|uniref:Guanine nucleotide-binding protein subunit gamma n=1 Tax=Naumovozyma dairenensis (strain ATCC 10597 / BCRC 20456 / CBS 421 / NBRC 0211 / NRRL Y-12639) TaxID=1071378 RepID=G0W9B2_NAUDC|nr:hypothetical protein NDAI_0D00590 [Naumovozyma dairenensis CBS 421]CCD24373.1 hypothetical protein NDAI_0D00590 [Naumovozyma dairenensis CBS 421]